MSLCELEKLTYKLESETDLQQKLQIYMEIQSKYDKVDSINKSLLDKMTNYKPKSKTNSKMTLNQIDKEIRQLEKSVNDKVEISEFVHQYMTIMDNINTCSKTLAKTGITLQKVDDNENEYTIKQMM